MTLYAFIGDSIGFGSPIHGVTIPFPTGTGVGLKAAAANHCISGGTYVTTGDIVTRWNAIRTQSQLTHLVLQGGVNDLRQDVTAANLFTAWEAIADDALGLGKAVIGLTVTPWGNYSQWTAARQTQTNLFNASVLGKSGITAVDLWAALGDTDPNDLIAAGDSGDGLHPNQFGTALCTSTILGVL